MELSQILLLVFGWIVLGGGSFLVAVFFWKKRQVKEIDIREKLEKLVKERTQELDETAKILVKRDLELTESNERLRDLDIVKSQFVSVAAHQLRTPLTGIKWSLHALLEGRPGKLDQEQKKFAGDAYKSAIRLIDLVNDLLDMARLEEGRFGFKMQKQPIDSVVREVCKNLEKNAQEKGIHFSVEIPKKKDTVPMVAFDKEKIGIVLENLIENAIKYTSPGGSITVKVFCKDNWVYVEVTDTGIGIPTEQIHYVFSKFFRAENAQLYQTSGTGIGLYLAKNIVEYHGGKISFRTKENKGSVFTFSLPIHKNNKKNT